MRTFEIYTDQFSKIIQADNINSALEKFKKEYPISYVIGIEDKEYNLISNFTKVL